MIVFYNGSFVTAEVYVFTGEAWKRAVVFCYADGEWK